MMPRYKLYVYLKDFFNIFISSIFLSKNKEFKELNHNLRSYLNVKNVLFLNQARIGIFLAVKAIVSETKKNEIILSPYTIADVINMVILAGGKPVFVDVKYNTCNIDESLVESKITDNTCGIIATHLHGLMCNMDELSKIAKKNKLFLIEDSAQSFGAKVQDRHAGTIGDIGVYSFGLYKNLSSIYGGAIVVKDEFIFTKIKQLSENFTSFKYFWYFKKVIKGIMINIGTSRLLFKTFVINIIKFGYFNNIKSINKFVETELDISRKVELPEIYQTNPSKIQAKLINEKIKKVDNENNLRIEFAEIYRNKLRDIKSIQFSDPSIDKSNIYTYFPLIVENMSELRDHLIKNNFDVGPQHYKNTASLDSFKDFFLSCPVCDEVSKSVLLLPTYPRYGKINVTKLANKIKEFYEKLE